MGSRAWALALAALSGPLAAGMASSGSGVPAVEWRVLGRGALQGDSLFVRASWMAKEPSSGQSTYVGFRIESEDGRVWGSDTIPDMRSMNGGWCDDLECEISPRGEGLLIVMTAYCWPCYPDVCATSLFVYVAGEDTVARSEWEPDIVWSPASGDSAATWIESDCVAYKVPLRAVVDGARIRLVPNLSREERGGAPFPVPAALGWCAGARAEGRQPRVIAVYPGPDAPISDSLLVEPDAAIEVLSAIIQAVSPEGDDPRTKVTRLELSVSGRHVFADPDALLKLGFWEP